MQEPTIHTATAVVLDFERFVVSGLQRTKVYRFSEADCGSQYAEDIVGSLNYGFLLGDPACYLNLRHCSALRIQQYWNSKHFFLRRCGPHFFKRCSAWSSKHGALHPELTKRLNPPRPSTSEYTNPHNPRRPQLKRPKLRSPTNYPQIRHPPKPYTKHRKNI